MKIKFRYGACELRACFAVGVFLAFVFIGANVTAQTVSVVSAATACPAPLIERPTSFLANGNFAVQPAGPAAPNTPLPTGVAGVNWSSGVPYTGNNVYPGDTSVAIQTGAINYAGGIVQQQPFPGDPSRGVPASATYLYANGNTAGAPYLVFRQNVIGLTPNRTYIFAAYVSNAIVPGTTTTDDPIWQFRACTGAACTAANNIGAAYTVPNDPAGQDIWRLVQYPYTTGAGQTTATFEWLDAAAGSIGDDGVITSLSLRECSPSFTMRKSWVNAAVGDAITFNATGLTGFNAVANSATETDTSPVQAAAIGSVLNLSETYTTGSAASYATTLACTGTSGLSGSTLTVGVADTAIVCTYTNTRNMANVLVAKTDSKTATVSGATNAYTVTLTNQGPSPANGVTITDTVGAGLTCPAGNTVSCAIAAGAAVCPAGPITISNLTGAGVVVNTLPVNGSLQFTYTCNVN